jgi:hypothetical protein
MTMTFRFTDEHEVEVDASTVLESHAVLKRLRAMSSPPARLLIDRIDRAASGDGDAVVSVPDSERAALSEAIDLVERDGELTPALAMLRDEAGLAAAR